MNLFKLSTYIYIYILLGEIVFIVKVIENEFIKVIIILLFCNNVVFKNM